MSVWGLGSKPQAGVLLLSGIQCQLLWAWGEVAFLGLPEGLLGSAHTQPGWPTRYCPTDIAKEGLGLAVAQN